MPKTKRSPKKSKKSVRLVAATMKEETVTPTDACDVCQTPSKTITPYVVAVLIIILFLVLAVNRGWVLAAIINGKPIFRWQLTSTLVSRFGKQTLESMISEQLIRDEAKKAGISVAQKEIDEKEAEILKSFGENVTLEEVLKLQGMTKTEFDSQVAVQLFVVKLLGTSVTINDEEVSSFIEKNKSFMTASDEAGLKEEARGALMEQKINEKIQPWFTEVKNKAKILRFL